MPPGSATHCLKCLGMEDHNTPPVLLEVLQLLDHEVISTYQYIRVTWLWLSAFPCGLTGMATMLALTLLGGAFLSSALALNDGVGKLPPMGYNGVHHECLLTERFAHMNFAFAAWNAYQCNVNEDLIVQTAQQMKTLGLLEAGYSWINLDDCYANKNRSSSGEIVAGACFECYESI